MFESGTYKSLPEHVALYEALEVSMERANRDKFFAEKEKSRKRCRDDQDPHLPPPDSNPSKKRIHASNASGSTQSPAPQSSAWKTSDTKEAPSSSSKKSSKERRSALSISKLKADNYHDFGLEELVPSLWIESERDYDISAAYGISHWWFKRKEFYITRHSAPSDCSKVRSHMRILSVVSLKTFERYGYTFLKEIVLRRADYKEYKISEADFKNLHPNDFEDMYLHNTSLIRIWSI
ncbi:hypothetical protein Tco_1468864 [Tanacetum coccineum]